MAWAYLTVAGLFEIGWAVGLKYYDGFSKPVPGGERVTWNRVSGADAFPMP